MLRLASTWANPGEEQRSARVSKSKQAGRYLELTSPSSRRGHCGQAPTGRSRKLVIWPCWKGRSPSVSLWEGNWRTPPWWDRSRRRPCRRYRLSLHLLRSCWQAQKGQAILPCHLQVHQLRLGELAGVEECGGPIGRYVWALWEATNQEILRGLSLPTVRLLYYLSFFLSVFTRYHRLVIKCKNFSKILSKLSKCGYS